MKSRHQKVFLHRLVSGYRKVDKLIAKERRKRLVNMSTEDSLREYICLCNLYTSSKYYRQEFGALEYRKIEFIKKRRQLLNKIGRKIKRV